MKLCLIMIDGGAGEVRTPYLFNAIEALDKYLEFLEIKALSDTYILSNRQYLGDMVLNTRYM